MPSHELTPARKYRLDRWGVWLDAQLQRSGETSRTLARRWKSHDRTAIAATENLINDWRRRKSVVQAKTAFAVGQALATVCSADVNGVTALYAAGYLKETIDIVSCLAHGAGGRFPGPALAAVLFTNLPLAHVMLDRVMDPPWSVDNARKFIEVTFQEAYGGELISDIDAAWGRMLDEHDQCNPGIESAAVTATLEAAMAVARSDPGDTPPIWSLMTHHALWPFVASVDPECAPYLHLYCTVVNDSFSRRRLYEYATPPRRHRNDQVELIPMLDGKTALLSYVGARRREVN